MRNLVLGAVALLVSLAAYPAMAGNVHFTLTDNLFGNVLSWALPESPVPHSADETSFDVVGPISGGAQLFGEPGTVTFDDFTFYTDADSGGFAADGSTLFSGFPFPLQFSLDLIGDQLFTGDTSAPTFRRGSFQLTNNFDGCGCGASLAAADVGDYTLTIGGGVPEPAAWAMMITGFAATGVALRRRRRPLAA